MSILKTLHDFFFPTLTTLNLTPTVDKTLAQWNDLYAGWTVVGWVAAPGMTPGLGQTVIQTLQSPGGPGEPPTFRRTTLIANVYPTDLSIGT